MHHKSPQIAPPIRLGRFGLLAYNPPPKNDESGISPTSNRPRRVRCPRAHRLPDSPYADTRWPRFGRIPALQRVAIRSVSARRRCPTGRRRPTARVRSPHPRSQTRPDLHAKTLDPTVADRRRIFRPACIDRRHGASRNAHRISAGCTRHVARRDDAARSNNDATLRTSHRVANRTARLRSALSSSSAGRPLRSPVVDARPPAVLSRNPRDFTLALGTSSVALYHWVTTRRA
jgi:hypothetical protein